MANPHAPPNHYSSAYRNVYFHRDRNVHPDATSNLHAHLHPHQDIRSDTELYVDSDPYPISDLDRYLNRDPDPDALADSHAAVSASECLLYR